MRPRASTWIAVGAMLAVGACRTATRCATCGMKIDSRSAWVSYLTVQGQELAFDTPRCALGAFRRAEGGAPIGARFHEYYSQELKPAEALRFVESSDVVGPMGPDLVPVAKENANRFARDHNGAPPKSLQQVLEGEAR